MCDIHKNPNKIPPAMANVENQLLPNVTQKPHRFQGDVQNFAENDGHANQMRGKSCLHN